jgi:hypothetical protein
MFLNLSYQHEMIIRFYRAHNLQKKIIHMKISPMMI